MGFFSWVTQDSEESISNKYSASGAIDQVFLHDNKGNVWTEKDYEGYGVFGGMPFYKLMGEMNGVSWDEALDLESRPKPDTLFPNLTRHKDWEWVNKCPANCPAQGYFYG